MKTQRCAVRECGAVVHILPLEQGEIAVDPRPVDVVVPDDAQRFRIVAGYRPHWASCVDIAMRGRHELG